MYLVDTVVLGIRALSFVAVFQAAGAALFLWLFGRELDASLRSIRALAKRAALAALVLTVCHHLLLPARMAGSFAATFDPLLEEMVMRSNMGPAHAIRVAALGLLAVSLDESTRFKIITSLSGVALTLLSFALMGHTTIHDLRWLLAPLLLVHIGIAAFWFGALWPLYLVADRETIEHAGRIITRFSAIAVWSVPLILLCGVAMAAVFIGDLDALVTGYGGMLIFKTAAFAVLLGLAVLNRRRFGPAIVAAQHAAAAAFKRVVRIEWALIACVLLATALLTSIFSPENLHASFSGPHEDDAAP